MELTPSLLALLQHFVPVFTTPTLTTFIQIVTGWVVAVHRVGLLFANHDTTLL